jgi:hypothetical protein
MNADALKPALAADSLRGWFHSVEVRISLVMNLTDGK